MTERTDPKLSCIEIRVGPTDVRSDEETLTTVLRLSRQDAYKLACRLGITAEGLDEWQEFETEDGRLLVSVWNTEEEEGR